MFDGSALCNDNGAHSRTGYQGMRGHTLILAAAVLALVSSLARANLVFHPCRTQIASRIFSGDGLVESDVMTDGIIGTDFASEREDSKSVFDIRTCDADNDMDVAGVGGEISNRTHVQFVTLTLWHLSGSSPDSSDDPAIGGAKVTGESTDTTFASIAFSGLLPDQQVLLDANANVTGSMGSDFTGPATEDAIPRATSGLLGIAGCALFLGIAACAVMRARGR